MYSVIVAHLQTMYDVIVTLEWSLETKQSTTLIELINGLLLQADLSPRIDWVFSENHVTKSVTMVTYSLLCSAR